MTYVGNYRDRIWNEMDRVCAVSSQIMNEFGIEYGDQIQLGAFMIDLGIWDKTIKKNTYQVVA